jgi:FlaA1/EpsC-like NDP-sugar epimerase
MFNLDAFIAAHVTGRTTSLFEEDLRRNQDSLAREINGRSVLVIGGGGTIGSAFVKAILHYEPDRLFVVDISENGLAELTRDLRSSVNLVVPREYKAYPIDFGTAVFEKMFLCDGPFDIVANFAAHKHVRSEKDHYCIEAMIDNNIRKALRLLELLVQHPPRHFFCVSTDKAANPASVMGATKKLMEDLVLAFSAEIPATTARFANVAFSNASLLDGFLQRMMKRQPLAAPSDIKRYFVSPAESGELCLLACILGAPGEILFPKLDPQQVKTFAEIAESFLEAYGGFEAERCSSEEEARQKAAALGNGSSHYPVYFFASDTSGEKPVEEFYTADEAVDFNRFLRLGVIRNGQRRSRCQMQSILNRLQQAFAQPSVRKADVVTILQDAVPTFRHIERGKSLDERM